MERKVVTRDRRGEIIRIVEHHAPHEDHAFWMKVIERLCWMHIAFGFTLGSVFTWFVVRGIR